MINDSNGTISTSTTINQRKSGQNIDGGGGGLMFILSGNGVDYEHPEKSKFAINTFTGELFLISPLNRDPPDGREQYRLQIQAEDEHSEKINGSITILIRVRDINDNQPYFEQNEYRAQVKENLAAGIDIIRLTAIDLDPDSILRYSIEVNRVNSDGDLIFDIDELSGLISTAVCCLDRESIAQYTIKICATDRSINGGDHHQQQQSPSIQSIVQQQQSMINQSSCTNVKIK
uniref:Neural-cadherin 2 n=1 Tax=Dermatophagoides pteronyssinus TaxID=6956 RepID=A0A6P6YH82_DERPT|nr:putative neural-cadherin 2 [Dermatophagoides pteronyssinus]